MSDKNLREDGWSSLPPGEMHGGVEGGESPGEGTPGREEPQGPAWLWKAELWQEVSSQDLSPSPSSPLLRRALRPVRPE